MPVLSKEFVKLHKICNRNFFMARFRIEKDGIGSMNIPKGALYGIHALRAQRNFPDRSVFPLEWYKSIGLVKQACYETCVAYSKALTAKYPGKEIPFLETPIIIFTDMAKAAIEISEGKHFDQFIVLAFS